MKIERAEIYPLVTRLDGTVARRERLGGLLSYYYREAA